ncbi:MAG: lysophospholipid acyltransferase family protein [Bdellovibrionaceae bacterium]|nr:lysophospholipid acyltransferase family protein [Pseudobdellovibrionaceae bacterium]
MNVCTRFLVRFVCWIFGLFPRRWIRGLGRPLGILWFDVLRVRRRVVLDNLRLAFPEWSESDRIRVGRKSVYKLNEDLVEFFSIPSMNEKWLKTNLVFEGKEHLIQALEQQRGVYALSLHLGHGDVAISALALNGFKIHLITKVFKSQWFNDLWFFVRRVHGAQYIEAHGPKTPFEILKAIRGNETVIFVNDQFMGRPFGIEVDFFGKKTGTAFGLALFYLKTRSPIVPIYAFEGSDGKFHLKIEPPLQLEHLISDDKEKTYALITQEVTHVIERIVREHPEDWMWVHRRWKSFD